MDKWVTSSHGWVAELEGEAECLTLAVPGTLRHLQSDLPHCAIIGVTTSRTARRQGLASLLTAKALAAEVEEGALVASIGMFEQGFYDQLGFGTGAYETRITFDPAQLEVDGRARVAKRVGVTDWRAVHQSRLARYRGHGSCSLFMPEGTAVDMRWQENGFGLGYFDGPSGELTHHFWVQTEDIARGPYHVQWTTYQVPTQFMELMALLKTLGDQIHSVSMVEPAWVQMQDLLTYPIRHRRITRGSPYAGRLENFVSWQLRICDLVACIRKTILPTHTFRFHLTLTDPIQNYLNEKGSWNGCQGEYVVALGRESYAEKGRAMDLPKLTTSVNAFTRLWLGVKPATGLALTDDLSGSPGLLKQLDEIFLLPRPLPDWEF